MRSTAKTVAAYLRSVPPERRRVLVQLRSLIRGAAPEAVESMHYGMPSYSVDGPLFAFAAQKNYLTLYVADRKALRDFSRGTPGLDHGKSCIRFHRPEAFDAAAVRRLVRDAARRRRLRR